MPFMTQAEYAKHRSVAKKTVTAYIADGHLDGTFTVDANGKRTIDSALADAALKRNLDVSAQMGGHMRKKKSPEDDPTPAEAKAPVDAGDGPKVPSYIEHRAIREGYTARLAKLDYEEKIGKLVRADLVKAEAFQIARNVRDGILNVADRIAPQIAGMNDPFEVHVLLTAELEKALEELSRATQRRT